MIQQLLNNPNGDSNNGCQSNAVFSHLSGQPIEREGFHNNMVPFFGSKVTQQGVNQGYEGILDIYTGGGSQQVEKKGMKQFLKM